MLVSHTLKPLVEYNPHIKDFIETDMPEYKGIRGKFRFIQRIRAGRFDMYLEPGINAALMLALMTLAGVGERIIMTSPIAELVTRIAKPLATRYHIYTSYGLSLREYVALLEGVGYKSTNIAKEVFFGPQALVTARDALQSVGINEKDFIVGISITGRLWWKQWGVEKFAQLADELHLRGMKVVIIGSRSPRDQETLADFRAHVKHAVIIIDYIKLGALPALISLFKIFVAMDTGPFYIADALNVPAVNIIGPANVAVEQFVMHERIELAKGDNPAELPAHVWPTDRSVRPEFQEYYDRTSVASVITAVERLRKRVYG